MLGEEARLEILRFVQAAVDRMADAERDVTILNELDELRDLVARECATGSGADLGGGTADLSGVFEPEFGDDRDKERVTGFANCYYQVGGRTYAMASQPLAAETSGYVALRISATGQSNAATLQIYADFYALQTAQADADFLVIPLYLVDASHIVCDMRRMPSAAMSEVL